MLEPEKRRFKKGWMKLRVSEIVTETHDTKTLYFVDDEEGGRAFDYKAGQYLTFRFDDLGNKAIARSYTMSSSPCEPDNIAITVKKIDNGLASQFLVHHVKVGDVLRARGPIGQFCYTPGPQQEHLAMIAAGSGVTPFVSMIREFRDSMTKMGSPKRMTLLVSYRSKADLISWPFLQACKGTPGIDIITTLSREHADGFYQGRIDQNLLSRAFINSYQNTLFMTCGPQEMMDLTESFLKEQGVPAENIKTESFLQ